MHLLATSLKDLRSTFLESDSGQRSPPVEIREIGGEKGPESENRQFSPLPR
jgi:hypothetical protein